MGLVSTTNSTLCILSVPSSTGTSEKEWKRVNSPRRARTLRLLRKTTKRSASRPPKVRVRKRVTATSSEGLGSPNRGLRVHDREQSKQRQTSLVCVFVCCAEVSEK